MSPRATIVVPTRDNAAVVEETVRSVLADGSALERELVVVDNGSRDDTGERVERLAAGAPFPVRLVREPEPGSSPARNAGVAAAQGELILFVDDDVLVADGWADALAAPFSDPAVGLVGGRILPLWPAEPEPWLNGPHSTRLTLHDFGPDDRALAPDELPVTANLGVRASLLAGLEHPFPLALGNHGPRSFGQEDYHLVRLVRATHEVRYAAGAVVHHRISRERMTLHWMRGTFFDMGVGLARSEREERAPRPSLPRRAVRAVRVCAGVRRRRRANDRRERLGPETWEELSGCMWAGKHVEMLLGRYPRLRDLVRGAFV
ncbi:MAG TPA: glycosyltransferase family A protein [Gaiellaceae bacterium]|nr:glycosyltransferase family A protein [Gaiellaceae bacterium]